MHVLQRQICKYKQISVGVVALRLPFNCAQTRYWPIYGNISDSAVIKQRSDKQTTNKTNGTLMQEKWQLKWLGVI